MKRTEKIYKIGFLFNTIFCYNLKKVGSEKMVTVKYEGFKIDLSIEIGDYIEIKFRKIDPRE